MKLVKLLTSIMLLLLISATPVFAERYTFSWAATGDISRPNEGARMSLTLKGTLSLGKPDYEEWFSSTDNHERNQWRDQQPNSEFVYDEGNPNSVLPEWVTSQAPWSWENGRTYYYEYWVDYDIQWVFEHESYRQQWYPTKTSWSGKLVAGWNAGTSPETWTLSMTPIVVDKTIHDGLKKIDAGQSSAIEHYGVWYDDGDHYAFGVEQNSPEKIPGDSYPYYIETMGITMNGKFSTKTQKLNGRMDLYEHKGWRYEDPENPIYEHNIHVEGWFGNYNFKGDG